MFLLYTCVFLSFLSFTKCDSSDIEILKASFQNYTKTYNKRFTHKFLEKRHFEAYQNNYKKIEEYNQLYASGRSSFRLGFNNMADLSRQRYLKNFVRLTRSEREEDGNVDHLNSIENQARYEFKLKLPDEIDWRLNGFQRDRNDQGTCGSCYALSIVQSIEGQLLKRTGKMIPLSAQQVVDCSIYEGNHGCSGGSLKNTLKYLQSYGGLMREKDYPYKGNQGYCNFIPELSVVNVTSWNILPVNDEESIRIAVATIGPIAASINAQPQTFQLYDEGIYDDDDCISTTVNHAVLVVGYTPDYWILKNWWGRNWGENGYMRLRRGKNMCGIARYASYAIV